MRRSFRVTGNNNAAKQASADWANELDEVVQRIPLAPQDYGATGDGDATDAFAALTEALPGMGQADNTSYIAVPPVSIPIGSYDLNSTLDFNFGTVIMTGNSTGGAGANGTLLNFPADTTGLRIQRLDTSGASTTDVTPHVAGDASIISQLTLIGSGTDDEAHGVHMRARATARNLRIHGFGGNGINIEADVNAGPGYGNANLSQVTEGRITGCLNGIFTSGGDANACVIQALDCSANDQFGVAENSFLGNTYVGLHTEGNGLIVGTPPSIVIYNGNGYGVIYGEEAWASLNAPSGTTADNQGWYYIGSGSISPGNNINEWAADTDYVAGGSFLCKQGNNCSVFLGCYHEGGQGLPQIDSPALIVGGILSTVRNVGTAGYIRSVSGGIQTNGLICDGAATVGGDFTSAGNLATFGPSTGDVENSIFTFQATGNFTEQRLKAAGVSVMNVGVDVSQGGYIEVANSAHSLRIIIGSETTTINASGIDLPSGNVISIGGTALIDTDTTLAGNSDTRVASQKAAKAYTDDKVAAAIALSGAKVRKSATLTAQNLTGSAQITWNAEDWDAGAYHDNSSNTERLTAAAAGYYEASAYIRLANVTSGDPVQMAIQRYNSSSVFQEVVCTQRASVSQTSPHLNSYGQVLMAAGDYLVVVVLVQTDTSVDIHVDSNFLIRRIA